jgi:hypothetical protein
VPFMIAGADPVATLFFWGSGIAVVGIVALYGLSSVATFRYFQAHPELDSRPWHTRIAPLLSVLVMLAALVLVLANFGTLVGGTTATAVILALTVPLAFVIGFAAYGTLRPRLSPAAATDLAAELS